MTLVGETARIGDKFRREPERVEMRVRPKAREVLRALLYEPEMRGVGYSEFIARAVKQARVELFELRAK